MYDASEILRAIDRDSISDALSKLEVFARGMGSEELADWARLEMHGYQGRPEFEKWAKALGTGNRDRINKALMDIPAYRRSLPIKIINGPLSAQSHTPMALGVAEIESRGADGLMVLMGETRGKISSPTIQTLFTNVRIEARRKLQLVTMKPITLDTGKSVSTRDNKSGVVAQAQSNRSRLPRSRSSMHVNEIKGKVHVAIITVRPDEYTAMEALLGETVSVEGGNNSYEHSVITTDGDVSLSVVLTRAVTQGNTPAQAVATNIIHEIDPSWLFLVGIAGGVPDHEFCLGDVVVASYLHDFSLKAATEEKTQTYQTHGGPMHPAVDRFLQTKVAGKNATRLLKLSGLLTAPAHPRVFDGLTPNKSLFYGDDSFRAKAEEIIAKRFPSGVRNGPVRIWPGGCANGDALVKSATLLQQWQESARQLAHIETELAGVYAAARSAGRQNYPLLAIRGLSDVVGFRRDSAWTTYACETAAGIAFAVLRSGFIDFEANLANERIRAKPVPDTSSTPATPSVSQNAMATPPVALPSEAGSRAAFLAADIARRLQEHTEIAFNEGDKDALERGPLLQISTSVQTYVGFVRFARHDRKMGRIVEDPNSQEALRIDTVGGPEYVLMCDVSSVRDPAPRVLVEGGTSTIPGPRSGRYRGPRR